MTDYELIVCIVNNGFSENVMETARACGARGGTVIHARGTASAQAEEFFHIVIQPDKEIVMILVPKTIRDSVLHALYNDVGLKTDGQGISFAMPVTAAVGLRSDSDAAAVLDTKKPEAEEFYDPRNDRL